MDERQVVIEMKEMQEGISRLEEVALALKRGVSGNQGRLDQMDGVSLMLITGEIGRMKKRLFAVEGKVGRDIDGRMGRAESRVADLERAMKNILAEMTGDVGE